VVAVVAATGLLASVPARAGAQPAIGAPPAPSASVPSNLLTPRVTRELRRRIPDIDLDHVVVRFRALTADLPGRLARAGAHIAQSVTGTSWTELATPNHSARRVRAALAHDPAVA